MSSCSKRGVRGIEVKDAKTRVKWLRIVHVLEDYGLELMALSHYPMKMMLRRSLLVASVQSVSWKWAALGESIGAVCAS